RLPSPPAGRRAGLSEARVIIAQRPPCMIWAVGLQDHKAQAPASVNCFILTISDTRTEATDTSGRAIAELLGAARHSVVGRAIVRDDVGAIRSTIERQLANPNVQVIITTGGTGITSRDGTVEIVDAMLEKRLDGFGELFRMLS